MEIVAMNEASLLYSPPQWTRRLRPSPLEKILPHLSSKEIISFALGLPDPELLPHLLLSDVSRSVLNTASSLQYCSSPHRLKEHIVRIMARRGFDCSEDRILVTTGAQQALSLLVQLLVESGSTVMLEELVYPAFAQILRPYGVNLVTIPTDREAGIDVDVLEHMLRTTARRPALLYLMSDGHNPLGVSLSAEKRMRLAEVLARHGVPFLEDDAYGLLSYRHESVPPISSYGPTGFYVGSFSKILGPALRVGWLVAPKSLIPTLSTLKEAADLNTASLGQRIACECLDALDFGKHLANLTQAYQKRRDRMIVGLRQHFPADTRFVTPPSGFFIWASLAEHIDAAELCEYALTAERIAFLPGVTFEMGNGKQSKSSLRLNFSNSRPAAIDDGIRRLGSLIASYKQAS